MNIDIAFEFASLDFALINKFLGIIERFGINKIEIDTDRNILKFNPITNKKNKDNSRKIFKNINSLILEIKDLKDKDFVIYIYSKNVEFTISKMLGFKAIGLKEKEINLFDDFLIYPNLLSFTIYNPLDVLLESMKMQIGSLQADNYVHLYPGYKLYINQNILFNREEFINEFKPKIYNNKFELSFSNSINDITLKNEDPSIFSFLRKNKYKHSLNYNSQIKFVNYLIINDVIKKINIEFENSGNNRYKNEYYMSGELSKQIFYLDLDGNSTIRKYAKYQYEIVYNKDGTNNCNLKTN